MKTVLIYRQTLLPISETFIRAQAEALRSFRPQYIGLLPAAKNLPLPPDAIRLAHTRSLASHARKALYIFNGIAPLFHRTARMAQPALLHAHFAPDGATALPLAAALKIPLIVTLHGYDVTMRDEYLRRMRVGKPYLRDRSKLWQRASLFICVSNFIRDKAIEAGFPKEKLRVHSIGIDRTLFRPAEASDDKIVLFIGRLVANKGCIYLIRAMQQVLACEPSARLVVIGDGPLRASLEQSAQELQIACEFLGSQPVSAVTEWVRRARLLCVPSITAVDGASEGLGMVSLEAQATGRPVVGFRTGGIPEAIQENVTGLLAPSEDVECLARHILRYLQDDAFWQSSSAMSIEWTKEHFDLDRQTRELEAIYEEHLPRV